MKTIEQIKKEIDCGHVFSIDDFTECVEEGCFIPYDGIGYFHDGENSTGISVWSIDLNKWNKMKYPYVIWYNK